MEPTIRGSLGRGPCRGPRRPLRPREPPTSGTHPRGVQEEGGALMRPEVAPPSEGLRVHPGPWLSHCPLPAAMGSPAPANYCPAPGWGRRGGGGGCLVQREACKGGPLEGSVRWKAEGGGCWSELGNGVLVLLVAGVKCPAGSRDGGQRACHIPPPPPTLEPDLHSSSLAWASGAKACPQRREPVCTPRNEGYLQPGLKLFGWPER